MGNAQSCVISALAASSVYFLYIHIYASHAALKTNVLDNKRLPSSVYLYIKYLIKTLTRRKGHLYTAASRNSDVVFTAINCRLETSLLRKFCRAAGYGWDYPDSEYRDTPLCFPEFLCRKLLLMVQTDGRFRLSPAGLVRVQQSLKTLQPVDELKKGPFMLQVQVQEYRQLDAGVEVDISMCATSRTGCPVWESVLTLLSQRALHKAVGNKSKLDQLVPENVKQVELRVPRSAALPCVWSFSDFSPCHLLFLPAWLLSRSQTSPCLWMLSVSLAEIEKHKGVGVIKAPVNITVQFQEPLSAPGSVTVRFGKKSTVDGQASAEGLGFQMHKNGSKISHMTGLISRS